MSYLAVLATAVAAAAPAPAAPAAPTAAADQVATIVVESRAQVIGDLQKGTLAFQPSYFVQVRPSTAQDMIMWLPGFIFQDTRDMRGLEGSGGNVLIDGKPPTSKTDTLASVLRRIPSDQVERVDVIVGGAPGVDMHGFPVIANVILKKSATRRGSLGVSSQFDTHGNVAPDVQLSSSKNENNRTVEYSLDAGRSYITNPVFGYGPWIRVDPTGKVLLAADTKMLLGGPFITGSGAYAFPVAGGNLKLNGSLRYYGSNIDETDALTSGLGAYSYTYDQTYTQGEFGGSYEHPLGKRSTLNVQALERPTHIDFNAVSTKPPSPSQLVNNQNNNEAVLRTTVRHKSSDKLTLESAAEGDLNSVIDHSHETLNGTSAPLPNAHVHIVERRAEVGETLSWKPGPKSSLDAALKMETSTFQGEAGAPVGNTFTYLKPRVVFTWSPDKDLQLRGRVEHEVGQLNFWWFTSNTNPTTGEVIAGNADLRPQTDWVSEITLQRKFWAGTADLSLTYQHFEWSDVIDYRGTALPDGAALSQVGNIGDASENDLVANLTLPLKRLGLDGANLKGTLTWSRSSVIDPTTGLPRRLSNKSALQGELHFAYDLPTQKLNVGFDAFYQGPKILYLPLGNQRTGVWARANLFVEYRARPNLNLRMELQDLPGTRVHTVNDAYQGVRGQSPLLYEDSRHLAVGPLLFLRARRTFN